MIYDGEPWWKSPYRSKNVRTKNTTSVYMGDGVYKDIQKGSFIAPVRKRYMSQQHPLFQAYDEEEMVAADTPAGFGLIKLEDLDW